MCNDFILCGKVKLLLLRAVTTSPPGPALGLSMPSGSAEPGPCVSAAPRSWRRDTEVALASRRRALGSTCQTRGLRRAVNNLVPQCARLWVARDSNAKIRYSQHRSAGQGPSASEVALTRPKARGGRGRALRAGAAGVVTSQCHRVPAAERRTSPPTDGAVPTALGGFLRSAVSF